MNATNKTTREIVSDCLAKERAHHAIALGVLAWLRQHDGKKLTKRNKPDLEAHAQQLHDANPQPLTHKLKSIYGSSDEQVRLLHHYGNLQLMPWGYYRHDCAMGWCLRIGGGECPVIDAGTFEERNPAYFDAAAARIRSREEFLAGDGPERLDQQLADYVEARRELGRQLAHLEDQYRIREALGRARYDGLELV
jgi:hypothetical protein